MWALVALGGQYMPGYVINFADVMGGIHEAYPTSIVEWFND